MALIVYGLTILVGILLFQVFKCCVDNTYRLRMLYAILWLFKCRHPTPDGSRIFITGSTFLRKLMIRGERLQAKIIGDFPAGCYHSLCNQILITKGAMYGSDGYGTNRTIYKTANIISHEYLHMLFQLEHGSLASIGLDNLCGYAHQLENSGLSDLGMGKKHESISG